MNCSVHPDASPALYCIACGRAFCRRCAAEFVNPATCNPCSASAGSPARRGLPVRVWILIAVGGGGCLGILPIAGIIAIAIPNMVAARRTANERVAMISLRQVADAQRRYRDEDWEADGTLDYADSLAELNRAGLIDDSLGSGRKGGYVFSLSGGTYEWHCSATPVSGSRGTRNFFVNSDGFIRFASPGESADASSPAIR